MDPNNIIMEVWKRGWSLAQLAADAGVSRQHVSHALRRPNPRGEAIILKFLGVSGNKVWPDRYDKAGNRIVHRGPSPRRGRAKRGDAA